MFQIFYFGDLWKFRIHISRRTYNLQIKYICSYLFRVTSNFSRFNNEAKFRKILDINNLFCFSCFKKLNLFYCRLKDNFILILSFASIFNFLDKFSCI